MTSTAFENVAKLRGLPLDATEFGVIGNGIASDTLAMQAAIDAAAAQQKILNVPSGAIVGLTGNLTIPSNFCMQAQKATFRRVSGGANIIIAGTTASSSALSADTTSFARLVRASTKGLFVAGDWVCLVNSPDVDDDATSKGRSQELARVLSISTSNPSYDELVLDRALAFAYSAVNVSTPATVHKIAPIENVNLYIGTLDGVTIVPKLARNITVKVSESLQNGNIQQANEFPIAGENAVFELLSTQDFQASTGPNAHTEIRAWRNLSLTAQVVGGREDGIRMRSCSGVNAALTVIGAASRGVNMYKVSGVVQARITNGYALLGEHCLIDFCENLTVTPEVTQFTNATQAVELRGRSINNTIQNALIVAAPSSSNTLGIYIHPSTRLCRNTTIRGGSIQAGAYGIRSSDGFEGLLIDGVRIFPLLDAATQMSALSLSTENNFFSSQNIKIQNCVLFSKDAPGIGCFGNATYKLENVVLLNNTIGPTGASTNALAIQHCNDVVIQNTQYANTAQTQIVTIRNATGGTFTLSYRGQITAAIAHNATAATVQTELNALSTIVDVSVSGSAGGPYTIVFGPSDGVYDRAPNLLTGTSSLTSGSTAYLFVHPAEFQSKRAEITNCKNVILKNNPRPASTFFYLYSNSTNVKNDDCALIDTPTDVYIRNSHPVKLDTFTDVDGTAIASHVPDIGDFIWSETSGPNATILSNAVRTTTNGNFVNTTTGATTYVTDLAYIDATSGNTEYSFAFDWDDASNFCAIKFNNVTYAVSIAETVAGSATTLATYTNWWPIAGLVHPIKVQVAGKYITVFLGKDQILQATMASPRYSDTAGWLRTTATTGASILSAIGFIT